jgi:hypothetical protein
MSTGPLLIRIWFGLAGLTEIFSTFFLAWWLYRRRVKLNLYWTSVPGYLENSSESWCGSQGRSGKVVVRLRALFLINAIAAALWAIPILSTIASGK